MKQTSTLITVLAAGLGLSLVSCVVDPYYSERSSSTTVVTQYRPGYSVNSLPSGYRSEVVGGTTYYRYNDVYYRPQGRGYVVVETPRNYNRGGRNDRYDQRDRRDDYRSGRGGYRDDVTVIRQLPRGAEVMTYRGQRYYRQGNQYYQSRGEGYIVVRSPY